MTNREFDIKRPTLVGESADVQFQRTLTILRNEGLNPIVTMEFSSKRSGVICGMSEVRALLAKVLPETGSEVWALDEQDLVDPSEVVLRIKAPYSSVGLYETAITGTLASGTGWATAASECVDAANGIPIIALGAHYVHPNVAAVIDYSSIIGGCVSCSTILGARLASVTPVGNMPHALALMSGDTVKAIQSFDRHMPLEVPRVALVDTFRDEAEEALSVARALREKLRGILIDTAEERGGITHELVKEVRARLDQANFPHVEIMVTGRFTPERIREFIKVETPINSFGVGGYIASASPIPFQADIQEIDGRPIAKRGRIPGVTNNPRLDRVM